MRRIIRQLKAWFFVRSMGTTYRTYAAINGQAEKLAFLAREFGKSFGDVLVEKDLHEYSKRKR